MDGESLASIIIGAISGGGVTASLLRFALGWRKQDDSAQSQFLQTLMTQMERLTEETDRLRNAIAERDRQIASLQKEVSSLRSTVDNLRVDLKHFEDNRASSDSHQLLEQLSESFPIPFWLCDPGSNLWYLNAAYCKAFNVRRKDFWTGLNIMRHYPTEVRNRYHQNDLAVIESQTPLATIEPVPRNVLKPISSENPSEDMRVVKVPLTCGSRQYVAGFCYLPEGPETVWQHYAGDNVGVSTSTRNVE